MSAADQRKALIRVLDAWKRITDSARSAASAEPLPNEPAPQPPTPPAKTPR